jgi:hypothetical protein
VIEGLTMPTGKTITAKEAGVFLPGMKIKDKINGHWATVIVPSNDAMIERPSNFEIFVRWFDGSESWVHPERIEYR